MSAWTAGTTAALVGAIGFTTFVILDTRPEERRSCRDQLTPAERRTEASTATTRGLDAAARHDVRHAAARRRAPGAGHSSGQPTDGEAQLAFAFGARRMPLVRRQVFRLPDELLGRRVRVAVPFGDIATEQGRPLPNRQVRGYISQNAPGDEMVTVAVCVNPSSPTEVGAGTYTGTALVGADNRLSPVS